MIKTLHFIRHAEVDPFYRGRYVGSLDLSLSEEGKRKARAIGENLSSDQRDKITVWCSPMKRCQESWKEISGREYEVIPDLREINFGECEGKTFGEIQNSYPELVTEWATFSSTFTFPNGEGLSSFHERMETLKKRILSYREESLLIVAHGGVITHLICLFLGLSPSQHLLFHLERPSLTSLHLHENGLGVLTGLNQKIRSIS